MQSLSEKRSEIRKITHNPEVSGSNPLPATNKTLGRVSFLLNRFSVIRKKIKMGTNAPLAKTAWGRTTENKKQFKSGLLCD
jgi:hypothetical protein